MKINSPFCDRHPQHILRQAINKTLSPLGDLNTMHTAYCDLPDCRRHYTRNYGYFDMAVGEHPNFGDLSRKPRCGQNHFLEYMVVTESDGSLLWACPVDECNATQPYINDIESVGRVGT